MFFETYISLCTQIEFSAIILTGGQNSRNIIIKEDASYCNLPNFPALDTSNFIYHSQNGFVTCGGSSNPGGCYTFTNGQWVASHSLTEPRRGHLSWQTERVSSISSGGRSSESGILLFGGVSCGGVSCVYLRVCVQLIIFYHTIGYIWGLRRPSRRQRLFCYTVRHSIMHKIMMFQVSMFQCISAMIVALKFP